VLKKRSLAGKRLKAIRLPVLLVHLRKREGMKKKENQGLLHLQLEAEEAEEEWKAALRAASGFGQAVLAAVGFGQAGLKRFAPCWRLAKLPA